jgi:glycosyltransferase involved in cell wall biosynthesis
MRIGVDLRLHAYAPGGISRYARRLCRAFVELGARGRHADEHQRPADGLSPDEQLVLISHRREQTSLVLPGTMSRHVWTPPHHRLERWLLGLELQPMRLDLLHSTDFIPPAWGARRRIITVHDLNFLYYPEYLTADARHYYNDQIDWAVSQADAIVVDSYATQRDLVKLLGVVRERVTVAHLAADERFKLLPPEEVTRALVDRGLTPGYILFVGVWEPRKNLPGLLEALALVGARGYRPPLVIAGRPGWLYDEIHDKMRSLNLEARVHFVESPSVDDLVVLYNGALLLAMPSFYEGFGLPALEAMQCGTPTVVSDRASLPEVVGDAGLLVDPDDVMTIADACVRIIEDPSLRVRLREAGFQQAATFSWRSTAEQTLAAYRAALGRNLGTG